MRSAQLPLQCGRGAGTVAGIFFKELQPMKCITTVLITLLVFCPLILAALVSASPPPAADGSASQLIESLGCRGCHRIQNFGGSLGPDLTAVGTRLTTTEIAEWLATHPRAGASQMMPSYSTLSAEEIDKLSSYLYNLR
jgi:mono/diheme cytochrome c family protein